MKKVVYTSFIFLGAFLIFACAPARQETLQSQKVEVETEMETKPEPVKTQSFTPAESRSFQRGVQSGDISKINFKTLPGYFLKPSAPLSKNVNVITINSEKKLAQVLGKSQFVKENYSHNFAQNFILVLAIGQSQYSYDIDITDVYVNDSQIYILYKITKTDDIGVRFFKTSAAIFEIARPKIATTIHFIDEAGTSFSIEYGRRTSGSPKSVDDLLDNYIGTYRGTLSAINIDGAQLITTLQLLPDFTFVLRQAYTANPQRVFSSTGKWAATEDLSAIVLNYDRSEAEQLKFTFIDSRHIQRLASNGEKMEGGQNSLFK